MLAIFLLFALFAFHFLLYIQPPDSPVSPYVRSLGMSIFEELIAAMLTYLGLYTLVRFSNLLGRLGDEQQTPTLHLEPALMDKMRVSLETLDARITALKDVSPHSTQVQRIDEQVNQLIVDLRLLRESLDEHSSTPQELAEAENTQAKLFQILKGWIETAAIRKVIDPAELDTLQGLGLLSEPQYLKLSDLLSRRSDT